MPSSPEQTPAPAISAPRPSACAATSEIHPGDPRLGALARFARQVVGERGWVDQDEVEAFLYAGFGEQQVLEVITGVALKTISNYTNRIAGTPLDEAFESQRRSAGATA